MKGSLVYSLLILVVSAFAAQNAHALPAFALREKVSCVMCHTNGSAPHLTHYGYLYRRAGFRNPSNIGNKEFDDKAMTFQEHMAAGVNVSYELVSNTPAGGDNAQMVSNNINVPEVEVWPLVGGFLGNYGVWSEIDATPTTAAGGGLDLSQADLRYVVGTPDLFFNFRAGIMAPEGFGASDQWFDDANIPLIDQLTANFNEDTLALPFGAMEQPELGAEFGLNYFDAHLTFGIYNGFRGTNLQGTATAPLTPALANQSYGFSKDYKLQLDQFVGDIGAVTAAFYHGYIPLMDPTGTAFSWGDHYNTGRLYLTWFALPAVLDIEAGGAWASNQYVVATSTVNGTFDSKGFFAGALWYVKPHLSIAGRYDWDAFNTTSNLPTQAKGFSFQVSLPYENNIFLLRFNRTNSDVASGTILAGKTNDFRAEWRFLF